MVTTEKAQAPKVLQVFSRIATGDQHLTVNLSVVYGVQRREMTFRVLTRKWFSDLLLDCFAIISTRYLVICLYRKLLYTE